jgi:hypothetical protein
MATIIPPASPQHVRAWSRTAGVANGEPTRGAQWRNLELAAQHYMMCRPPQPGGWSFRIGIDAEDAESVRGVHFFFVEPMCWGSTLIWAVFDGYNNSSPGDTEKIIVTLYIDGIEQSTKEWVQGYESTYVDWLVDGTSTLQAMPTAHHVHIVARAETGSLRTYEYARSWGAIHRSARSYVQI